MSERRYDRYSGQWVTVATHRQDRTFLPSAHYCPLCPTTGETTVATEIGRSDFEIAVFDNRFPSMWPQPPQPKVTATGGNRIEPAYGRCEVVVYSADHNTTLAEVGIERLRLLVDVWADRYLVLAAEGHAYVMPFENKGEVIGVTLEHPHGQIYAFPAVPSRPLRALTTAAEHRASTGRCLHCDVLADELADGARLVVVTDGFLAWVPFAPRFPYEVHIAPRTHVSALPDLDEVQRDELAGLLARLLPAYDRLFGFALPYVMAIQGRPSGGDPQEAGWSGSWAEISHLMVEFTPPHRSENRLKYLAGAELMGGAFVIDVAPEQAAARLRAAVASDPA